jgi:SGNH domain (fused to AT3 domains)
MAGYRAAWDALPPTVRRIVVIRDTPKGVPRRRTQRCIERALSRRRSPSLACAQPRARGLDPDPAVAAAQLMHSPRVRVVDLTDFFCGRRRCYPVIGGALVLRDENHLTGVFSGTLGPFLLRAVDALG